MYNMQKHTEFYCLFLYRIVILHVVPQHVDFIAQYAHMNK